jgi:hypothetical protein
MLIYFNGDSNVAGEELPQGQPSMAEVIGQHYGAAIVNHALSGASNDRIYDTTLQYVKENPAPDLIIVGWTEHGREQWWLDGSYHQINTLDIGTRPPESMRRRYQLWKNYIKHDRDWHRVMGIYWHNRVFNLHTMLKEKGIPHMFFNAFFHFHIGEHEQLDWSGHFYCPYSGNRTYVNWCIERGFPEITPGWLHFPSEAHAAWANELIQAIAQADVLRSIK